MIRTIRLRSSELFKSYSTDTTRNAIPLRNKKPKSSRNQVKHFVDVKQIRAIGGKGGDGCISYLQLWANDRAGPDGGDGGNGGHVILEASENIKDLEHIKGLEKGKDGDKGSNKDCHGKSASHTVVEVPVGTLIHSSEGEVIGDLDQAGSIFILARGGSGGKGNSYFVSASHQRPYIAEYGAHGEDLSYVLQLRTMAAFGLMGMPNAGKSTLLQAVSRAKPKVAPYPFTTLKPHVGVIHYHDYQQIPVADLPGLVEGSHKNYALGIGFLRHAERCSLLAFVLDASHMPLHALSLLRNEVRAFSPKLALKPWIVIANKMDLPKAQDNLEELIRGVKGTEVIPVSAKFGINLTNLLKRMREIYDKS